MNESNAKPLAGRRVVITRARSQAGAFATAIEELGGEVVEFPTIEILPPQSYDSLDLAVQKIEGYDWIIFTSVNGAERFLARLRHLKRDIRPLDRMKIAAIGPETARALEAASVRVDRVPREYRAEGILLDLRPDEVSGKRILLPRAAKARDILPETLREWGAVVDVVEAYRTVPAKSDVSLLKELFGDKKIDIVAFTSSSTAAHFASLLDGEDLSRLLAGAAVACIGPITQQTAEEKGMRVDVVAKEYTIEGLTRAIVEYFKMQNAK